MSKHGWWLTLRPPEQIGALVASLQEAGLLLPGRSWWFAWNALEMALPGPLSGDAELDADWETLRVFSERAELRVGRRGQGRGYWLLLEEEPRQRLEDLYTKWVVNEKEYSVEKGHHLLAGQRLQLPGGAERGEILYPRALDYGVGKDELELALVAAVWNYYDAAHRLATVRYAALETAKPGDIPATTFSGPGEVLAAEAGPEIRGGD
jgi:hypothetical protein